MPETALTFSVIIPCKQAERTLQVCLASLQRQTRAPLEIIVVNDGSTDRTVAIAEGFGVKILHTSLGTGAAAARKAGAESAQGSVLVFLDSDCEAPPDWLEKFARRLSTDPALGAVGGGYTHPPIRPLIGKLVALEEEYCHHLFALNPEDSNPPGGNFALRREHWKRLRTSRELYYFRGMASGEDSVFCEELRQITKVLFCADNPVCHHTNEYNKYFVRHINRGKSRMSIRLYKLASPRDNRMTMEAYGGLRMVGASAALWLAIGLFLWSPWAALLSLGVHFALSHKYFAFAKQQMRQGHSTNPISFFESTLLRGALAVRLACWAMGASLAVKSFVVRAVRKWTNVALSIAHFWIPGRVSKLFFFVTARCNARCTFCFNLDNVVNWDKRKPNELTLAEITTLAKNFGRLPYMTLSGGEPFIRPDLVDVIAAFYEHSHTQWVTIPSNAALTEVTLEKTVQILNRCPDLFLTVQASLDSLEKDHDESRNLKDGFKKMSATLEGWAWLCKFYPNLRIQLATCYDDFNKDRIEEIIRFTREKFKVHQQILYLIRDAHTLITQSNNHLMPSFFHLINDINDFEAAVKKKRNSLWHRTVSVFQAQVSRDLVRIKRDKAFLRPCHATSKFFTLYDDGQVSPCEVLDKTSLGNLRDYGMDYYRLKRGNRVGQYYQSEILDKKCNCDWTCATPINMLYDPKTLLSLGKQFFVPTPVEPATADGREFANQNEARRTYNQGSDTWNKVQKEREKTLPHVLNQAPRSQASVPPPPPSP